MNEGTPLPAEVIGIIDEKRPSTPEDQQALENLALMAFNRNGLKGALIILTKNDGSLSDATREARLAEIEKLQIE